MDKEIIVLIEEIKTGIISLLESSSLHARVIQKSPFSTSKQPRRYVFSWTKLTDDQRKLQIKLLNLYNQLEDKLSAYRKSTPPEIEAEIQLALEILKNWINNRIGSESLSDNRSYNLKVLEKDINVLNNLLNYFEEIPVRNSTEKMGDYQTEFIDESLLEELSLIESDKFDLTLLLQYCKEINDNFSLGNYASVIFLTRALLDHIPPIFDQTTFSQVASQFNGKSFKEIAQRLENLSRKIADYYLHSQIKKRISTPTRSEIDFSSDLNFLLNRIKELLEY